ncbi:MAG: phosphotransferase family protein [Proteobacteria bacterium]|nr:phosphotransferase family protein [Pseudomonadota bacterium]
MGMIDEPTNIREGEELDLKKIEVFLKDSIKGIDGGITIKQFPGGYSNLTYAISSQNREMVLRRPPFGKKAKTAHDMGREYNMLKALKPVFPYCPEPLVYSEDPDIMGCPFYVMERLTGIILRKNPPKGMAISPDMARQLCHNLISVLNELHSIDYAKIGLSDFGKPEGYVKRQVEGWSKRYRNAKTDDAPDYEAIMGWLSEKMPEDTDKPAIIHNDYKFDNVVLNPENPLEITGILDWEMATIGDPLMDLGSSLGYWINRDDPEDFKLMRTLPTTLEGMLSRDDIVRLYGEKSGRTIDCFDFYLIFGMFRLAVIAQQIYYRYYHGQTKDERFALLIGAVELLEKAATGILAQSRL